MNASWRTSSPLNENGMEWAEMTLSMRNFNGHGCARSASVISTVDTAAPPSAGQWRRTIPAISRCAPPAPGWVRSSSGDVVCAFLPAIERSLLVESVSGPVRLRAAHDARSDAPADDLLGERHHQRLDRRRLGGGAQGGRVEDLGPDAFPGSTRRATGPATSRQ